MKCQLKWHLMSKSEWTFRKTLTCLEISLPLLHIPLSDISLKVSSGYLVVVFVYVTEFTGSKVRTWTSMHVHAAFAVGVMVVALVGYLIRVWWLYQIILTLSTSPFLLYCWKFPETPFYLMAKERHREAQELLDTMARWNGLDRRVEVWGIMEIF